jgi:hypothetical protein
VSTAADELVSVLNKEGIKSFGTVETEPRASPSAERNPTYVASPATLYDFWTGEKLTPRHFTGLPTFDVGYKIPTS